MQAEGAWRILAGLWMYNFTVLDKQLRKPESCFVSCNWLSDSRPGLTRLMGLTGLTGQK